MEAKKGNQKAKVLHFYSKLLSLLNEGSDEESSEDDGIIVSEWPAVFECLNQQENDPQALLWLGYFAGMVWKDHPADPEQREKYFSRAVQNGVGVQIQLRQS